MCFQLFDNVIFLFKLHVKKIHFGKSLTHAIYFVLIFETKINLFDKLIKKIKIFLLEDFLIRVANCKSWRPAP